MATTVTLGVTSTSTANTTSYTTGSFTPAAGDGLIVFVGASGTQAAATMTDSQSLGWTLQKSTAKLVLEIPTDMLYMFTAKISAAASSMTVTFDCTGDAATGCNIAVLRIAGHLGDVPIFREIVDARAADPLPIVSFGLSGPQANNACIGAAYVAANPSGLAPPTGWTEDSDTSHGTPAEGMDTVHITSGSAQVIEWTANGGTDWAIQIAEIYDPTEGPEYLSPAGQSGLFGVVGSR